MSELYRLLISDTEDSWWRDDFEIDYDLINDEINQGHTVALYAPHGTYDVLKEIGQIDEMNAKYGDKFHVAVG